MAIKENMDYTDVKNVKSFTHLSMLRIYVVSNIIVEYAGKKHRSIC